LENNDRNIIEVEVPNRKSLRSCLCPFFFVGYWRWKSCASSIS